jgi:hypothetical protein
MCVCLVFDQGTKGVDEILKGGQTNQANQPTPPLRRKRKEQLCSSSTINILNSS